MKISMFFAAFFGLAFAVADPSIAACSYTFDTSSIVNGKPALAQPISDNFNYILNCPNFTGNVGIGNTNPEVKFEVGTHQRFGGTVAQINGANVSEGVGTGILSIGSTDAQAADKGGSLSFTAMTTSTFGGYPVAGIAGRTANAFDPSGYLQFSTSASNGLVFERMRIDQNGNVGIGTTSPSYLLQVNGTGYAASWQQSSDRRLKTEIKSMVFDALAKIMALHPVTFRWKTPKDDGMQGIQMGLVAQDVENLLPTAVLTAHDISKTKSLKYNELTTVLIRAVQEQQAMIERQAQTIRALSSKSANFEARLNRIEHNRVASAH